MAKYVKMPDSAAGEILAQGMNAETTKQAKADAAEKKRRAEEMKTQGRANCKLERLNCSLTPSNFDFVRKLSRAEGLTMTKYVNKVLTEYREYFMKKYPEKYEAAVALCNILDGEEGDE